MHGEIWDAVSEAPVRRAAGGSGRDRRTPAARAAEVGTELPFEMPFGFLAVVIVLGLIVLFRWINILNEYERGVIFRLGRCCRSPRARASSSSSGRSTAWCGSRCARWCSTCRRRTSSRATTSRSRSTRSSTSASSTRNGGRRGRELPLRHLPARADHAALGARPGRARRRCWPSARSSTTSCRRSSTTTPSRGASRSSAVEVKHVDLPQEMQRAMARQAEAEREKRAKIIHAEGEFQAAQTLAEAADVIEPQPGHAPAALPADADRDRHREELDDHLPAADRHHQAVPRRPPQSGHHRSPGALA